MQASCVEREYSSVSDKSVWESGLFAFLVVVMMRVFRVLLAGMGAIWQGCDHHGDMHHDVAPGSGP